MKTISDSDWHEAEKIIRKYMETVQSRAELKRCVDLLAKIEEDQVKARNPYNYPAMSL